MARAMESLCMIPPENPRTIWLPRSVSLNFSSRPSARSMRSFDGDAKVGRVKNQDFAGGEREIQVGRVVARLR